MGNTLPPLAFYRGLTQPLLAPIPDGAKTLWSLIAAHCYDGTPYSASSGRDAQRYFAKLMNCKERQIRRHLEVLIQHGFVHEQKHEARRIEWRPLGLLEVPDTLPIEEAGQKRPALSKQQEEGSSSIYTSSFNTNSNRHKNLRSEAGQKRPVSRVKKDPLWSEAGQICPTSRPVFGQKRPASPDLSTPAPTPVDNPVDMSDLSTIEREMIERLDAIGIYGTYARSAIKKAVGSDLTPDDLIAYAQTVIAQCRNARNPMSAAGWRLANRPLKRLTLADQRAHDRDADTKRRFAEELE
jgi:hypothetical protein